MPRPSWHSPVRTGGVFSIVLLGGALSLLALVWSLHLSFVLAVSLALGVHLAVLGHASYATASSPGARRGDSGSLKNEYESPRTRQLTLASYLTVSRGVAAVLLAGFVAIGQPAGVSAWLPVVLFAVAAAVDGFDGVIARATDSVTALGARLDGEMDALALLVGSLVVVRFGQAPVVFLAVGLARYAFVGARWFRTARGRTVDSLPPRWSRKLLGAFMMVVIFLTLMPVLPPSVARPLAVVAMIPFLAGFVRDWLLVTGRLG